MKSDPELTKRYLKDLREPSPLSVTVPEEYGGNGASTKDFLIMDTLVSYESLPLALLFGINGALFLQPIAQHADEETKREILPQYLEEKQLGGLMITEPDFGTDALNMTTGFEKSNGRFEVSGLKHWAGLTGWADHWLVAARQQGKGDSLGRDISLFLCEGSDIEVTELYDNLGVSMLPYGRNEVGADLDDSKRLDPNSSGLRMMQDFFHRSRLQFPGMATGYLRRIRDEAYQHCTDRVVGGKSLTDYEHVRRKLRDLQAAHTISSAMCVFTSENLDLNEDVSGELLTANCIKAFVTDLMQQAADTYLQLAGADGYRSDHLAGQSYVDTRSFQIFEGPNDVLFDQVGKQVLDRSKKESLENFAGFVNNFSKFPDVDTDLEPYVSIPFDQQFNQSQRIELGELTARLFSLNMVRSLSEYKYSDDTLRQTESFLRSDIRSRFHEIREKDNMGNPPLTISPEEGEWMTLIE
jgi:alkylation response protein AidB-like acyl-CoA dehydrogenase